MDESANILTISDRFDRRLHGALGEVDVPADLQDRLLARLSVPAIAAPEQSASRTSLRRTWASLAVAASLLVACGWFGAWWLSPRGPVDIVTLTEAWEPSLDRGWQSLEKAPSAFAVPSDLAVRPRGWQSIRGFQGYRGIAYDLSRAGIGRAILYVVQVKPDKSLPTSPPPAPQFSSSGRGVAAWLVGNKLCVLVIDGDQRAYRSLIRRSTAPLA